MALYSSIQSYFHSQCSGRYIAHLLTETCRCDPDAFARFFRNVWPGAIPRRARNLELSPEFSFPGRSGRRQADLAVSIDGEVIGLVELKYRDGLMPETGDKPAQLEDYLSWCKRENKQFLLLHRAPLGSQDIGLIKAAGFSREHYSALGSVLQREGANHACALMLDYLKDEGLLMDTVDHLDLYRFLHRLLKPWKGDGRVGTRDGLTTGIAQFKALFDNLQLVAAELTPELRRPAPTGVNRGATVEFDLQPQFDSRRVKKHAEKAIADEETEVLLTEQYRKGGWVVLFAQNALGQGSDWAYVRYGIELSVSQKTREVTVGLYAAMDSATLGYKAYVSKTVPFAWVGNPDKKALVESTIQKLVHRSAAKYLSDARNASLPPAKLKALSKYFGHLVQR